MLTAAHNIEVDVELGLGCRLLLYGTARTTAVDCTVITYTVIRSPILLPHFCVRKLTSDRTYIHTVRKIWPRI